MEAQALETARPEQTLGERLRELNPEDNETRAAFLGRAAGLAAEYPEYELAEEDLATTSGFLPNWHFSNARLYDSDYGVARRTGWAMIDVRAKLGEYRSPRRLVSTESNNILLLASQALNGSDLAVIFEIERASSNQITITRSNGHHPPAEAIEPETPPELEDSSRLSLSSVQIQVVRLMPLPSTQDIANTLGMPLGTVGTHITKAQSSNRMRRQEFLAVAIDEGKIDMSLLPEARDYELTDQEKKVLTEYTFSRNQPTAKALDISQRYVSVVWQSVYSKLGCASTRTHAFLTAKRDGLI